MTLSARRFSIQSLMVVVLLVAADFGIVRGLWGSSFPPGVALAILPMANLLILASTKVRSEHPNRRFWLGFELVGWFVILVIVWLGCYRRQVLFFPMIRLKDMNLVPGESENLPLLIAEFVVIYAVPQILAALIGGWLFSRCKTVFNRS